MNPLAAVTAVAAARAVASIRQAMSGRQQASAPAAPSAGDLTELSDPARLIEALLTQDGSATGDAPPARPLLAQAPSGAGAQTALTLALQRGFGQSGLFYESHLADWLHGALPLAELAREPQGQLPALAAPLAWPQQVDPRVAGIVQQQLVSLDTQVFPWRGEVWPGQPMDWQIAPDSDPDGHQDGAAPADWTSRLRLTLPQLGVVDAELRWSAAGCSLRIAVPAARLAGLRAALPQLAQALNDAGVRPQRIVAAAQRESGHG